MSPTHATSNDLAAGYGDLKFTPRVVGNWYVSPLITQIRTVVPSLSRMFVHPFFSGPDGVTIDKLDANVTVVGSSGSVLRMGIYQLSNQTRPFSYTTGSTWATLLVDAGTVATDGSTGQKVITLGTAQVIAANTWFAIAGVDQVATAATRHVGGQANGNWFSPFGSSSAGSGGASYGSNPGLSLYQDSVTAGMPSNFQPTGITNTDSGVGLRRSA